MNDYHDKIKAQVSDAMEWARKSTIAALIEKMEGMKVDEPNYEGDNDDASREAGKRNGRNQALDDLLTHLRGEGHEENCRVTFAHDNRCNCPNSPPQEETECCEKCLHSMDRATGEDLCENGDCPCHRPRTEFPRETHMASLRAESPRRNNCKGHLVVNEGVITYNPCGFCNVQRDDVIPV